MLTCQCFIETFIQVKKKRGTSELRSFVVNNLSLKKWINRKTCIKSATVKKTFSELPWHCGACNRVSLSTSCILNVYLKTVPTHTHMSHHLRHIVENQTRPTGWLLFQTFSHTHTLTHYQLCRPAILLSAPTQTNSTSCFCSLCYPGHRLSH